MFFFRSHEGGIMVRPEPPPILLGELRRELIQIMARCTICSRMTMLDPTGLPLPDEADMTRVAHALKCGDCGRAGGNSAHPDPKAWVRYLRRSGQRHREPWYAPMIRDEPETDRC
jgi:hypothetical protein